MILFAMACISISSYNVLFIMSFSFLGIAKSHKQTNLTNMMDGILVFWPNIHVQRRSYEAVAQSIHLSFVKIFHQNVINYIYYILGHANSVASCVNVYKIKTVITVFISLIFNIRYNPNRKFRILNWLKSVE